MVLDPTKQYNLNGSVTNADGSVTAPSGQTTQPAAQKAQPSGIYMGTSFSDSNDTGNGADWAKTTDARDFMYGRDPNYGANTAANERSTAANYAAQMNQQGQGALANGNALGQQLNTYGQQQAYGGQQMAGSLQANALGIQSAAMNAQNRAAPQASYGTANQLQAEAERSATGLTQAPTSNAYAAQLAGMNTSAASGAQAQLQSGLNQSEASNLALARSGRGFGASSSALNQAVAANAAAGQQTNNQAALLQAQADQAAIAQRSQNINAAMGSQNTQNAQTAQNLANAGQLQATIGNQYGTQALSQAQLQAQQTAENDQLQAALTGQALGAQNNALQGYNTSAGLGLTGMQSGANASLSGETLGMQGTQQAMGMYGQGEQMAGLNMSAQQQSDLARESGLLTQQGINQGLAVSNQAAINAGWGTALSTAGTIGAATATAVSDASAKTNVQSLDKSPQAPAVGTTGAGSLAAPIGQAAGAAAGSAIAPGLGGVIGGAAGGFAGSAIANGAKPPAQQQSMAAPALQASGAVLGGAIGTAIAPGVGTAIGGVAGSLAGSALGHLVASDVATKENSAPLDAPQLGYGVTNPSGSTQAGAANAFTAGRTAAAAADSKAAYNQDLHDQAQTAAMNSLIAGAGQDLGSFVKSADALSQYHSLGPAAPQAPMGGGTWGSWAQPGMVASDVHSKRHIEALHNENQALKAQLNYPPDQPPPTMDQLNAAYAAQQGQGAQIQYPSAAPPPTQAQLNAAAQAQYSPVVASDENAKSNIQRSAATDMVEAAPGYAYDYIDPARHGYGRNYGPMAQDLASTPAGASTVRRMPDGKLGVDTNRLSLVNTAALHTHQEELKRLRADIDQMRGGKGDAKLSRDLDAIDDRYSAGLSGGSRSDAALSRQLDAADRLYSAPMAPAAPTLMPTVVQPGAVPTARFADVPETYAPPSYLVADNAGAGGASGYGDYAPPAAAPAEPSHHFWEVQNPQTGGYVPFWQLPAEGYAPAQQILQQGRHLFGRG